MLINNFTRDISERDEKQSAKEEESGQEVEGEDGDP